MGEIVDLGVGEIFVTSQDWGAGKVGIGIKPADGRETDWLDPRKLYRLHDQTVEVVISPIDKASMH